MWLVSNWRKAISKDSEYHATAMVKKGVGLSSADEELIKEQFPWDVLDYLIRTKQDDLFERFVKLAPNSASTSIKVIDAKNYRYYSLNRDENYINIEVSLWAFCFKIAITSGNYFVFNYAKSRVSKSEITKPIIWGMEQTMLNHILHGGGGRHIKKILLSVIDYDPQVNIPCHKWYKDYSAQYKSRGGVIHEYPILQALRLPPYVDIINKGFTDFDEPDKDKENIQILKRLINNGANPNVQDEKNGSTPLHYANKTQVEYLLSVGANPYIEDKHGFTAIESQEILQSIQPFDIPSPFDGVKLPQSSSSPDDDIPFGSTKPSKTPTRPFDDFDDNIPF